MSDVVLVACVKTKRNRRMAARDLYASPMFKKARAYAERHGRRWFILSARHGLLSPDRVIMPYERTLGDMTPKERRDWALMVMGQMEDEGCFKGRRIEILAGLDYRLDLMPFFWPRFDEVVVPMRGLRMGEQLAWLNGKLTPSA